MNKPVLVASGEYHWIIVLCYRDRFSVGESLAFSKRDMLLIAAHTV